MRAPPFRRGAAALFVLLVFGVTAYRAGATGEPAGDVLAAAKRLAAALDGPAPTADYVRAARSFGALIDEARNQQLPVEALDALRKTADRLRDRTRARLAELEAATHEQEGALEDLYRSAAWDDLSFALAAFPYWRAWIDLTLADRVADQGLRPRHLLHAKQGFRAASMQLFQPSLVYGGWFGLGHVALAEGTATRAIEIFETLQNALAGAPDHPLNALVAVELRLLRVQHGEVAAGGSGAVGGGTVDGTEARLLRAEAFALLERHRKTKSGAKEAAMRLNRLIRAGHMDNALLGGILRYRAELVGEDLGRYGDLVAAEYAFENEQHYTAVQKYTAFFAAPLGPGRLDLDLYRYHEALANLKSDLVSPAIRLVEALIDRHPGNREVAAAAAKLAYVAHARRFKSQESIANRTALANAARRFLASAPNDPDAEGARLVLVQTAPESEAALRILETLPLSSKLQTQAAQTRFQLVSQEFLRRATQGNRDAAGGLAHKGLKVWEQLPPKKQHEHEMAIAALQMRAMSDGQPEEVLKAIKEEEARPGLGTLEKQGLLWARLRVYERFRDDAATLAYLQGLAQTALQGWQLEQIYPWVRKMAVAERRAAAARALLPGLGNLPEMDRRFRALLADALLESGDAEGAYNLAKVFVGAYPKSGDGWQLLARTAERTNRPFEAERAWRVITDGSPPSATIWWEGMLSRVQIRATSTRPESACELLAKVAASAAHMPAGVRARYTTLSGSVACAGGRG